jgi:hypothetical protein
MTWFRRKPVVPAPPLDWTEDLWREAFGGGNRFHGLVLVQATLKRQHWSYENRSLSSESEYTGRLGCRPGSALAHVHARVSFDLGPVPSGGPRVPPSAIGWARAETGINPIRHPATSL